MVEVHLYISSPEKSHLLTYLQSWPSLHIGKISKVNGSVISLNILGVFDVSELVLYEVVSS